MSPENSPHFFKGTEAEYCTISPLSDLYFNRPRALIEDREVPAFTYHGLRHEGLDFLGSVPFRANEVGQGQPTSVSAYVCLSLCSLNGSLNEKLHGSPFSGGCI